MSTSDQILRWMRLGGDRQPHLEDVAERAAVLSDLCRKYGYTEDADALAETAANAQIELAFPAEGGSLS